MIIPTLTTPRLLLRGWRASDREAISSFEADPDSMRYIGSGDVHTADHAASTIAGFEAEWVRHGHGRWAVELRDTGETIGSCGFVRWHEAQDDERPELAYGFLRQWWRQGLACEAGRAAIEWAFASLPFGEIIALTHPANAASKGVLLKLGFEHAGEVHVANGREMGFFRIARRG